MVFDGRVGGDNGMGSAASVRIRKATCRVGDIKEVGAVATFH